MLSSLLSKSASSLNTFEGDMNALGVKANKIFEDYAFNVVCGRIILFEFLVESESDCLTFFLEPRSLTSE